MVYFADYYQTRELLQSVAPYFKLLNIFAALLAAFSLLKGSLKLVRFFLAFSFILYTASFIFLLYFHQSIYNTVFLTAPFLPSPLRLFPPFWIETEKLFFWTLLLLLFFTPSLIKRKKLDAAVRLQTTVVLLFLLLNAIIDPFSNPLPDLHEELKNLEAAAASGFTPASIAYVMNFYYRVRYFYHSAFMWTHPPLLFLSYAIFTLALPLNFALMLGKGGSHLEVQAYRLIASGYFFLTLGMLIGYPWAVQAWQGEAWWWSPKINVSIMMWLFYTAYLHGRLYPASRLARYSHFLAVLSFAALVFTYLSTYILPGVHSYG